MNYKIGDRVICTKAFCGKSEAVGKTGTVIKNGLTGYVGVQFDDYIRGHGCAGNGKHGYCWNFETEGYLEKVESNYSIHITCTDNKTTHAVKKVDGKIVARAMAVCCPSDTFDFAVGANLAYDRLMRPEVFVECATEAVPEQPKQEDKPKFKAGDMVKVIGNGNPYTHYAPIGSIQRVVDVKGTLVVVDYCGQAISFADIEPYTEPETTEPKLIVSKKMLEDMGACNSGVRASMENFPSGEGEFEAVGAKAKEVGRGADAQWLENRKDIVKEKQSEPKQEPVKLYCVKEFHQFGERELIKGKVYEFDGHRVNYEVTECFYAKDFESWKRGDPSFSSCLVPLVSRPAKVGEWVYVNHAVCGSGQSYKNGDIFEVTGTNAFGESDVFVKGVKSSFIDRAEYLVLDGYKPEPEKAEPEYLNMRVVCVESADNSFTVGKPYEFKDGTLMDNKGNARPSPTVDEKIKSLSDTYMKHWPYKFIEFKGE